ALGAGAGAAYLSTVNAQTVMGLPHPPQLPKYTPPVFALPGGAGASFIPTGQHLALIDAALAADGIPQADWPRWEAGMNVLIQRESGWNANSVNRWDINAKRGTPSGGLTQTIGPTFAANRNPSLPNNMFDPVANIAASINYIRRRYGDISNVQQANPNLPPKGYAAGGLVRRFGSYDNGGQLEPGWTSVYNGTGKPENVRTAAAEDALLSELRAVRSAIADLAKRPVHVDGEVLLDGRQVVGAVRNANRQIEHEGGVGVL
ncbi:transglycosylase SLT domain-containing protein, partial [Amycolatopsis kentuckyensis]|uniref:transglycosylase SLT domain-containing protein n=1 Tax=Amycolatopsis kentuckyensis TaxID=218823 RepID=UPI001302537E